MAPWNYLKWGFLPTKRIVNDENVQEVKEYCSKSDHVVAPCATESDEKATAQEITKGTVHQWQHVLDKNELNRSSKTESS